MLNAATPREKPARFITRKAVVVVAILAIAAAIVGLVRTRQTSDQAGDEAAWWKFDGASGLLGSVHGQPRWTGGKLGKALQVDGLSGFVSGAKVDGLPQRNAPRTLAVWIKPEANLIDDSGIFHYGAVWPGPPGRSFSLALTRLGKISLGSLIASSSVESSNSVADGAWRHVAGTWDGSAASIYIDGKLDTRRQPQVKPDTGDSSGWIGRYLREGTPFRGAIDDVRVYSRALKTRR